MKIVSIVGTRPNFIKIASLVDEFKIKGITHTLVHTGQHYDKGMSKVFFDDLNIPKPDINLGIGSITETKELEEKIIGVLNKENPDFVLVVGDVNSTLAGAKAAHELGIKLVHVESGLRSFDKSMPEEINRIETDKISDLLFTTEKSADKNLLKEGIGSGKVHFVGNVMIDTLLKHKEKAKKSDILSKLSLEKEKYAVLTLHRPGNVDSKKTFENIISILEVITKNIMVVFPIHPRSLKNIENHRLKERISAIKNLKLTPPIGYLDFLHLMDNSKLVLTDSGGMQEETTVLGVPCITLRENTERPITLEQGTNLVVSTDKSKVIQAFNKAMSKDKIIGQIPKFWDGKSAQRITEILIKNCNNNG
jgi:UDP-N-acetylglucosamine 2-epimerase (non-hydrolysing)